jgi:hypothetical protein
MAIEHGWHEHDQLEHVYYYKFLPGWTWDEFFRTTHLEHAAGRTIGDARYDVIGDFSLAPGLPKGLAISSVARTMRASPPNRHMAVVVSTNSFISTMINAGSKLYREIGDNFGIAHTVDQAYEVIVKARKRAAGPTKTTQPYT